MEGRQGSLVVDAVSPMMQTNRNEGILQILRTTKNSHRST